MTKSFGKQVKRRVNFLLGLVLVLGLVLACGTTSTAYAEEQNVEWSYSTLQTTIPDMSAGQSYTVDGITLHVLKGSYRPNGDSGVTFAGDGAESFQFSTTRGNFTTIKIAQNLSCLNELYFMQQSGWRIQMEPDCGLCSVWRGKSNVVTFGERFVPDFVKFTIAVADPTPAPPDSAPTPAASTEPASIASAPAPVAVTDVSLNLATATVQVGDKVAITAAVSPNDAANKKVRWSIAADNNEMALYADEACTTLVGADATDVLTVYAKADNKAVVGHTGKVTVASDADGAKSASCSITYIAPREEVVAALNASVPNDQRGQGSSSTATSSKSNSQSASKSSSQTEMTAEK